MTLAAMVRHRTVIFLLLVGAAWAGWGAFLHWSAPGRIDPALRGAMRQEASLDVAVTLGFPPEDFHIRLFQGYGVVSGVRGTRILLNRLRPEEIRRIAQYYWVRRITLQP